MLSPYINLYFVRDLRHFLRKQRFDVSVHARTHTQPEVWGGRGRKEGDKLSLFVCPSDVMYNLIIIIIIIIIIN